MYRLSAIARLLDPSYSTNLAIVAFAFLATLASGVFQFAGGADPTQSLVRGVAIGFSVFFTWMLGRELDPDHDSSAFLAASLGLIGIWLWGLPNFVALLWSVPALRILNRTVGPPAKLLDSLFLLGLAAWLSLGGGWIYALLTAVAFGMDSLLPSPRRRHWLLAGLALLLAVLTFSLSDAPRGIGDLSRLALLAILSISAVLILAILNTRSLVSLADQTQEPLDPARLQAARALALATALSIALWNGQVGVISLIPLWACLLGIPLTWGWRALKGVLP